MIIKCPRCGKELPDTEAYEYMGQMLCEECFLERRQASIDICDPVAARSAIRLRKKLVSSDTEGLTEQQIAIYEIIKSEGRATEEEIMQKLKLDDAEMHAQLAVLRHCELIKGHKDGDIIYLVPFDIPSVEPVDTKR